MSCSHGDGGESGLHGATSPTERQSFRTGPSDVANDGFNNPTPHHADG